METQEGREAGFKGWLKHVWDEGLARKLVVDHEEKNVVRLPLTLVVIGAVVAPWLAALGAIIAVVTGCRLAIERDPEPEPVAAAAPEVAGEAMSEVPVAADAPATTDETGP